MMATNTKKIEKPLTLKELAKYSEEVLFPAMEERFVIKEEFKDLEEEFKILKNEFQNFKNEFKNFKDNSFTFQDLVLKKLDIILTEKEIREYQKGKEKKLWTIFIEEMKKKHILSEEKLKEINQLEIF